MTTELPADAGESRRLHPWSWLFVTLQHLRQFLVPLLVLLFAGRGDRNELWPLIGVAVLAAASVWEYFTYRYRLLADHIEVRSGLFERRLREVPYARIHNVALHQTILHRVFGVAEVRLESAGGTRPEAEMRVLRMDHAMALEQLVRERGAQAQAGTDATAPAAGAHVLLALDTGEVVRHGLVSNRGMVLVVAGFAGISQFSPDLFGDLADRGIAAGTGYASAHQFQWLDYAAGALVLLVMAVVALRVLSVAASLLQFHGFTLSETGRRLTVVRGLLNRMRDSIPKRRIQAWTLREQMLHRWLRRRSLAIDTATSSSSQQTGRGLRDLAPIATPGNCDALVRHLLPQAHWPPADWQPLHPRTWLRLWLGSWLWVLPVTALLYLRFGGWGLLGLLWLPWSAFLGWKAARCAGWSLASGLVCVRQGWWSKQWRFAEVEKLQALRVTRSPLDRLFGMRSLWLDTAGAGLAPMRIPFMPPGDAAELRAVLSAQLAKSALRW